MISNRLASLCGIVLFMSVSACTESARYDYAWTSSAAPGQAVLIDNLAGPVRVRKGAVNTKVSGEVRVYASGFKEKSDAQTAARAVVVSEERRDGALVLAVQVPDIYRNRGFSVSLDLVVPAQAAVSVFSDNGNVRVEGLAVGEIDTTSGAVELAFTQSPSSSEATKVRTSDGTVTSDSHDGDIDVVSVNAPISLFSVAGSVRATTTLGAIAVRAIPPRGGEVLLATTNAPIDLGIPRDFGARVVAVTSEPGIVEIAGDLRFTPTGSFPNQAQGVLGDGAGRVDLRTMANDIIIHR